LTASDQRLRLHAELIQAKIAQHEAPWLTETPASSIGNEDGAVRA